MRGVRRGLVIGLLMLGLLGSAMVAVPSASAADFYYKTWAQNPNPNQYTDQVVWVQLCYDQYCNQPMSGATVHTEWNYRTTTSYADWHTGSDGRAAMIRNISDATIGYTVRVDIFVFDDGEQIDSAYFTPGSATSYTGPQAPAYTPPPAQQSSGPVSGSGGVCPSGYPVKANDNSGIYHVPGGQLYEATNARNCFATPGAAQAAGYRASLR